MRLFRRQPEPLTAEQVARRDEMRRQRARDEAYIDRYIEAEERAQIPCLDCEVGEPHACERAWWQQRAAHIQGRECDDPECVCHPERCACCGQVLPASTPANA